jgi:hypothetical protein
VRSLVRGDILGGSYRRAGQEILSSQSLALSFKCINEPKVSSSLSPSFEVIANQRLVE